MLGAIPTVLLVIAIGGRWIAKQALAPVEAIVHAASRVSVHNLDQRLPVPPTADEIAELIAVMNATLDRLQRSFEQSVRFSAEASHHLKTPISVLRAGIEEILTDPETPAKQQTRADALLHQVHQLTSIAENLLLLARARAAHLRAFLSRTNRRSHSWTGIGIVARVRTRESARWRSRARPFRSRLDRISIIDSGGKNHSR